jgi:hypothetical protein
VALTFGGDRQLVSRQFQPFSLRMLALKGGGLIINRHELSLQYGFMGGSNGDLGQRATLGYGYRLGSFTLCGRAQLGMSWDQSDEQRHQQRWLGADLMAKWHYPFGPFLTSLALGGSLQRRHQAMTHLASEQAATGDIRVNSSFFAAGPMTEGSIDLYLGANLSLGLGVYLTSLFFPASDDVSFSLDGSLWTGVAVDF